MSKDTPTKPVVKKANISTNSAIQWVDGHILPILAVIALLGLAVRGVVDYLPILNHEAQLIVGIIAVAFLGFKAFAK